MKKLTYSWIILFLLSTCTIPENDAVENTSRLEKSSAEIEKLILAKEIEALNYWAEGSFTGYTIHFDNEVTFIDDIGAHNRIDGLPAMHTYAAKMDSIDMIYKHRYELINPKVQVYPDFAIVTFQYHPFKPDDTPGTKWKATSVYALIDNDWKVVHGHWSMLKTE
jgi:hypothetical protein